jgi:response regulator of citrate/malate metabolism
MDAHSDRYGAASVIHVLIANFTGVVAEMVQESFQQQPDIKLIGNIKEWEEINAVVAETDVLVVGADDVYSPPEDCLQLLSNCPNLKILVLTNTSDEAIAYWRALHCHQMQVTSSQNLIESIRQIHSLSPC